MLTHEIYYIDELFIYGLWWSQDLLFRATLEGRDTAEHLFDETRFRLSFVRSFGSTCYDLTLLWWLCSFPREVVGGCKNQQSWRATPFLWEPRCLVEILGVNFQQQWCEVGIRRSRTMDTLNTLYSLPDSLRHWFVFIRMSPYFRSRSRVMLAWFPDC